MTGGEIRKLSEATPFLPFRVYMANGKSWICHIRAFMHLSPTGRRLIVDRPDDTFEIIDVLLVTSLETLSQNGSRPRGKKSRR